MSLADELQKLDELRRRGALNDAEFERAKAALLNGGADFEQPLVQRLSDQLSETRYQNDLSQIDREWEIERETYLIPDKYGRRHVPSVGMSVGIAAFGGVFGVLWTIMAFAITNSAPDFGPFSIMRIVFPLFGLVFIGAAIGFGAYSYSRAQKYNAAFFAYQTRRAQATGGRVSK